MVTGYFLENGQIIERELEVGKEYYVIEFFNEKGEILDINKIENIEDIINRYDHLGRKVKFMGKLKFLGETKNKNKDELYKIGDEEVNKNYVLFEMI